jgi:FkbH-like protein
VKFLEAAALAEQAATAPTFVLASSANLSALEVFVAAHSVLANNPARMVQLPFGTLQQHLRFGTHDTTEVRLLMPWDFLPELDWRTGLGAERATFEDMLSRISTLESLLASCPGSVVYLDCPIPPCHSDHRSNESLRLQLLAAGARLGSVLPSEMFSLDNYCATGSVLSPRLLDAVASEIVRSRAANPAPGKVLVTDLDGVMWHGVIGEDGANITCAPNGRGYSHFIYQNLLLTLQRRGVIIAAVSRNDAQLAEAGLSHPEMTLKRDDFVAVLASYQPKSSQIENLARHLNLGLESFVFVDDNPVELHEVQSALPQVTTVQFPVLVNDLPEFSRQLDQLFSRAQVTEEDLTRTNLYRVSLAGLAPSHAKGADIAGFLQQLAMRLIIREPGLENSARALQLINKTNQFNLNGQRLDNDRLRQHLQAGARLFTATLEDRFGSHGEILACLVARDGNIETLVMSCRVLQRQVESAFLGRLNQLLQLPRLGLRYQRTAKNEPTLQFLRVLLARQDDATDPEDGLVVIEAAALSAACKGSLALFEVELK